MAIECRRLQERIGVCNQESKHSNALELSRPEAESRGNGYPMTAEVARWIAERRRCWGLVVWTLAGQVGAGRLSQMARGRVSPPDV